MSDPTKFTFTKDGHLLKNRVDVGVELSVPNDPVLDLALATNAVFPAGTIKIADTSGHISGGSGDIAFDDGQGLVTFKGSAGAHAGLGVYATAKDMLADLDSQQSILEGLAIQADESNGVARLVALHWDYNLSASVNGSVALGSGAGITFGADGATSGFFAVVRGFAEDPPSQNAIASVLNSWRVPRQVRSDADLEPGTWLIAEVDGEVGAKLGAKFGFDQTWVRELKGDPALAGLIGPISLRVQAALDATLGFNASGKHLLVVARESVKPEDRSVRVRLFKRATKGWDFALNAGVDVTTKVAKLEGTTLDDFLAGLFGTHGAQLAEDLKEFRKWTDTTVPLPDQFAGFVSHYVATELANVAGPEIQKFETARKKIAQYLDDWSSPELGHSAATLLWSQIRKGGNAATEFEAALRALAAAGDDPAQLQLFIISQLNSVEFFNSPIGMWIEATILGTPLSLAITENVKQRQQVAKAAQKALSILDGKVLNDLIAYADEKLNLNLVKNVVNQAQFDNLEPWLKKKLSQFLATQVDLAGLEKLRATLNAITKKADEIYATAIKALNDTYKAAFHFTYASTTTSTALMDVSFDFGQNPALGALLRDAINGNLGDLLMHDAVGLTLGEAALTHGIKRQSHINIVLPHFEATIDHINTSLATMKVLNEGGVVWAFDFQAEDKIVAKQKWMSSLSITGKLPVSPGARVQSFATDAADMSFTYRFRQASKKMRTPQLEQQMQPLIDPYFPRAFGSALAPNKHSLHEFIGDLDNFADAFERSINGVPNGTNNLGNVLLNLEVSLPGRAVAAWFNAPDDKKDAAYLDMSRRVQRVLRRLIPNCFFQDPSKYKQLGPASTLLVYKCLPVSSQIKMVNGSPLLDQPDDLFWDVFDPDKLTAMVNHDSTKLRLAAELRQIKALMEDDAQLRDSAGFYADGEIGKKLKQALTPPLPNTKPLLETGLLFVEAEVIKSAQEAGLELAKFRQRAGTNPEAATKALDKFGSKVTDAFHNNLGSLFAGKTLRELCGVVFLEAACAFDETLANLQPLARLDVTLLRPSATDQALSNFLDGQEVDKKLIAISQPIVGLPS